jgi:recombinational DNA repair ATPase RecF
MRLSKIEWRNFASYGNKVQSLSFDDNSNLYLVVGENGAGKSSISDVITFGLYGKLDGKKLKDMSSTSVISFKIQEFTPTDNPTLDGKKQVLFAVTIIPKINFPVLLKPLATSNHKIILKSHI